MSTWKRNDLVDMFDLSSATGSADDVCAETLTGTQLQDAQHVWPRAVTLICGLLRR